LDNQTDGCGSFISGTGCRESGAGASAEIGAPLDADAIARAPRAWHIIRQKATALFVQRAPEARARESQERSIMQNCAC
jgi:hypothetical protein